jgi:endoglycosylceramidase
VALVVAVASTQITTGGTVAASAAPQAPAGVHVVHLPGLAVPYLSDGSGRWLLLRGVDSNALVQYSDQPGCSYQETVPLTGSDISEMAALGFDFLRLAISWSRLEPEPGQFSSGYLGQITQVMSWARDAGIDVLVDMHQDRYNRNLWCGQEVDGAPDWATLTFGAPCAPLEVTSLCAQVAEQAFWSDLPVDGRPLQSWYLGALRQVAAAVEPYANLAGIELMNEPVPGLTPPEVWEATQLYPFYDRMIAGLRRSGFLGPLWFEPSALRDVTDNAVAAATPFSTDSQLVYAVHIYTGVFSYPPGPDNSQAQLVQSYVAAAEEARAFDTPWVDDEFGGGAGGAWDIWLQRQLDLQNQFSVGSGFWLWKQQPGFYNWEVVRRSGNLRSDSLRAQQLSLPHLDAAPGVVCSMVLDPPAGTPGTPGGVRPQLTVRIAGSGGTAIFWGGTAVTGGPGLMAAPWTSALVDGKPVPTSVHLVSFSTGSGTAFTGALVDVHVPAGEVTVTLTP